MIDELVSLRVLVVCGASSDHDLFRRAASASKVPIEIIEAESATSARRSIEAGVDLVYLDAALGGETVAQVIAAARAAPKPSFTVLLCAPGTAVPFQTEALADKPLGPDEAIRLLAELARVRLPCRVLVVDDSATMRGIVRKILAATRFPLEVTEADQGGQAIELARKAKFDIVFLDYNMPGFNGLETISEFRRHARHDQTFVLMSSTRDQGVIAGSRAQGAAFLRKPFFPADIEAVLCRFYGLRALNAERV